MEKPDRKPALLLTVGTGDVANLEQTLLVPIRKSIQQGEWAKVILIPSALTEAYARSVRESSQGAAHRNPALAPRRVGKRR